MKRILSFAFILLIGLLGKSFAQPVFAPEESYYTGSNSNASALADFDGDGNIDVVVSQPYANAATVLLGNGNGTFTPQTAYPTGSNPFIVVADINSGGILDMVTGNGSSNDISVPPFGTL